MSDLKFTWLGSAPLVEEVIRPLCQISFELEPQGRPTRTTLWRADGTGLRVQSQMHDLRERIEVGVLSFDLVSKPKDGEKVVDLGFAFSGGLQAMKLVVSESGDSAESGLVIRADDNKEILIVASSHPYQLAVQGILSTPHIFEPEYPLDWYAVVDMS